MMLGVVLAGGESRRFGSDKALADLDGRPLLNHAASTLFGWCDHVVVAGRSAAPVPVVADWPRPGMGPLAGLVAALRLATERGDAAVLSIGVDVMGLPPDLPERLQPAPAHLAACPVIGLWPVEARAAAERLLLSTARHSMRAFAEAAGSRPVSIPEILANLNTPADLLAFRAQASGK